jgi:O-antigen/teichoic acid export membrane protein
MRYPLPDFRWPFSLDARSYASTAAANGVLAVSGVLSGMLAARLLGVQGRGELAAVQAWPLFLSTLGSFGLTEAIAYYSARCPSRARSTLATAVVLAAPFTLVAVAAGMWLLPRVLRGHTTQVQDVATMCLVLVPLMTLTIAPSQALRGVGRYASWNLLRLITPLAWLAVLIGVQGTTHADVRTLALAFIGTTALAGAVAHVHAWNTLSGSAAPDRSLVGPLLNYSAPTVAGTIPNWLNLRLDQLLGAAFLDAHSLGLYVVAIAWRSAAHPLATVVAFHAVPALAGVNDSPERARMVYRIGTLAAVGTCVLLLIATPLLLPLVFGVEFSAAVPAALLMVVAGGLESVNAVGAECLRGVGRPRRVLVAECVGLVITLVALPVLMLTGGIVGAASASLVSLSAIALTQQRLMPSSRDARAVELTPHMPPKLDPLA